MTNNFDMLFNNTSEQTSEFADVIAITQTSDAPVKIPGGDEIINKIIWAKDSTEILKLFCDLLTSQFCNSSGDSTTYPKLERRKDRKKNFDLISSLIYDELLIKKGLYQITLKNFNDLVININYTYYFGKYITRLKNSQTALDKIQRVLDDLEIKLKCESGDSVISIDRIVSTDLNGNVVKYQPGNIQIIPWVLNCIKNDLNLDNQIDYKKYEVRVRNKFLGKPFICEACEKPIVDSTPHRENMCRGCHNDTIFEWQKNNKDKIKEYYKNNKDKIKEYRKEYDKNNKDKLSAKRRQRYKLKKLQKQ